jgi:hypothetical protein
MEFFSRRAGLGLYRHSGANCLDVTHKRFEISVRGKVAFRFGPCETLAKPCSFGASNFKQSAPHSVGVVRAR